MPELEAFREMKKARKKHKKKKDNKEPSNCEYGGRIEPRQSVTSTKPCSCGVEEGDANI